jgi:hypothetical protein
MKDSGQKLNTLKQLGTYSNHWTLRVKTYLYPRALSTSQYDLIKKKSKAIPVTGRGGLYGYRC